MAATVLQVYEAVRAAAEAALLVNVNKGFPDWARAAAVPPLAALELASLPPESVTRIGQARARRTVGLQLYLFGRHEPELCGLLDGLFAWLNVNALEAGGQRVDVIMTNGERYKPEAPVQQEQHAFWLTVLASWSA